MFDTQVRSPIGGDATVAKYGHMDNSSFGPLGKCKLLCNEVSIVITRDGQQLLEQTFKKWKESNEKTTLFPFYVNTVLQKYGEHFGDGVHTIFILYHSMKSSISKFNGSRRMEAIEVFNNILAALHNYETLIVQYMVSCGVWHRYSDIRSWCLDIFHCVLLPAANSGLASKVSAVLMEWIFPTLELGHEISNLKNVLENCIKYRTDLSLFLFSSSTAAADVRSQHQSKSFIDVLDPDEVLISGHCLDLSALTPYDHLHCQRHFICIQSLFATSTEGDFITLNLSSAGVLLAKLGIQRIDRLL